MCIIFLFLICLSIVTILWSHWFHVICHQLSFFQNVLPSLPNPDKKAKFLYTKISQTETKVFKIFINLKSFKGFLNFGSIRQIMQ